MSAVRGVLRRLRRPAVPVLVITGAVLAMALMGGGNAERALVQSAGSAWVVSPGQGLLSLIDGPSDEIVASVALPGGSEQFEVEQSGSSAYVADVTAGTVAHVDGATGELSQAVQFGTPDGGLSVLQGGEAVFVLDSARRTAQVIDPDTLEVERSLSLTAEPGPGQAVVDDQGRLWVLDTGSRSLTWFDDHKHVVEDPADGDRLILVRGSPVLIDTARARVQPLDDQGRPTATSCLEVRDDEAVELLGSASADEIYAAVPASGNLLLSDVTGNDCERVVSVAEPGTADFGPLAQSGRFVFVPDRAAGRTIVVDTRDDTRAGSFDLVEPGHDVELIAKDGVVFYNDRDGSTAGVLRLQNGIWETSDALQKFNPDTGEPATSTEPPGESAPPTDPPTTRPTPAPTNPPAVAPDRRATAPRAGTSPRTAGSPSVAAPPAAPPPSTPPPPPAAPPVVDAITMTGAATLGQEVTFSATSDGTGWAWTLSESGGAAVATSTQPGSWTVALPATGTNFLVTLTVTGPGGSTDAAPFAFAASDPFVVQVTGITPDAGYYAPMGEAWVSGSWTGPASSFEWSAFTPSGNPVAIEPDASQHSARVPFTEEGVYRIIFKVYADDPMGHEDEMEIEVESGQKCYVNYQDGMFDFTLTPSQPSVTIFAEVGPECPIDATLTFGSGPPWLQFPGLATVRRGPMSASFTVSLTGTPPAPGTSDFITGHLNEHARDDQFTFTYNEP